MPYQYRDMLEAVRQTGNDSAILYFHWFADVEGNRFEPAKVLETRSERSDLQQRQFLGTGVI